MMRGKIVKGLVLSSLSLGLFVGADSVSNNSNFNENVFAKSSTKVIQTKKNKTTSYHAVKGNLYSSAKLNKVVHYAKNYKHTTFYSNRYARIKTSGGKIEVVNYVKNSSGSVKGWINHHNLKKVTKTSSKAVTGTSKLSAKFLKDSKVSKSGYIAKTNGARIKLSTLKRYYGPSKLISDPDNQRVATLTNGHKIYWAKAHPQYATEVMPGSHSNSETFTNPTKHWVMYWLGGNLPDDFSHKGFKDQLKQYGPISAEYPAFLAGKYGNFNNSALYNWNQKILLVSKKWYNWDNSATVINNG
ncbi:hypothetical protein LASUN_08830 [Lentilactobacillus sunkii]|jgi:hypothetical protein|uniref:Uncharacterized protein n=1 Tax=Lentilactobacillus sunkii TaxID=481719 RepID=A0A1E7XDT7_9LACO|nr:hypothetical protein [Lentilactobacillus sunkii]OFA11274.1 hypothetical protein LASUN_08830 [Lentilactobacillus sunkii]